MELRGYASFFMSSIIDQEEVFILDRRCVRLIARNKHFIQDRLAI